MGDPFIGEIKMVGFRDWADCNGNSLAISQNAALYALLAIQFRGDGNTNMRLPISRADLRSIRGISPPRAWPWEAKQ